MDILTCTHCGAAFEGEGIRHRRRLFCGDECCETFEEGFLSHGGPDEEDLKADDTDDVEVFDEVFLEDEDEDGEDDLGDDHF